MKVKKVKKMVIIFSTIVLLLSLFVVLYMQHPKFGRIATGERLARITRSANFSNGMFRNQEHTPQITSDKSRFKVMYDFLFEKRPNNRPSKKIAAQKIDLKSLGPNKDLLVWFGHSSYYIQSSGKRILVDPVFEEAAPLSFLNKPFEGSDIYKSADIPDIDFLVITHDHWDHLDYRSVVALRDRVNVVVCPLGVGEHFEYWGYNPEQIAEMDWNEKQIFENGLIIHTLPSRHFSGRTFKSNQTLWASFMIETNSQTIYLSGDGGYGSHFAQIAEQFPNIHYAIMENGQYNEDWRYIHLMPEDLKKAISDLNPKRVFAGHNGKYALAKHAWNEPLDNASTINSVVLPMIGEVVYTQGEIKSTKQWWI